MANATKSGGPRMLTGITQLVLLALSVAIALVLLANVFPLTVMVYLAVTAERIPQTYEVLGMAGTMVILGLILAFLLILRRIVITAGKAPFAPENALSLQRLGWIALAWQVVVVIFAMGGNQINIVNLPGILISIVDAHSYSAGGAIMVLAIFVLAHVFRMGAEMRDDLEGTV
jgi:hypothetical protein